MQAELNVEEVLKERIMKVSFEAFSSHRVKISCCRFLTTGASFSQRPLYDAMFVLSSVTFSSWTVNWRLVLPMVAYLSARSGSRIPQKKKTLRVVLQAFSMIRCFM